GTRSGGTGCADSGAFGRFGGASCCHAARGAGSIANFIGSAAVLVDVVPAVFDGTGMNIGTSVVAVRIGAGTIAVIVRGQRADVVRRAGAFVTPEGALFR